MSTSRHCHPFLRYATNPLRASAPNECRAPRATGPRRFLKQVVRIVQTSARGFAYPKRSTPSSTVNPFVTICNKNATNGVWLHHNSRGDDVVRLPRGRSATDLPRDQPRSTRGGDRTAHAAGGREQTTHCALRCDPWRNTRTSSVPLGGQNRTKRTLLHHKSRGDEVVRLPRGRGRRGGSTAEQPRTKRRSLRDIASQTPESATQSPGNATWRQDSATLRPDTVTRRLNRETGRQDRVCRRTLHCDALPQHPAEKPGRAIRQVGTAIDVLHGPHRRPSAQRRRLQTTAIALRTSGDGHRRKYRGPCTSYQPSQDTRRRTHTQDRPGQDKPVADTSPRSADSVQPSASTDHCAAHCGPPTHAIRSTRGDEGSRCGQVRTVASPRQYTARRTPDKAQRRLHQLARTYTTSRRAYTTPRRPSISRHATLHHHQEAHMTRR